MLEALCGVGGGAEIEYKDWQKEAGEATFVIMGNEGKSHKAICILPDTCRLKNVCTGKVNVIPMKQSPRDRGLHSKATMTDIVFQGQNSVDYLNGLRVHQY